MSPLFSIALLISSTFSLQLGQINTSMNVLDDWTQSTESLYNDIVYLGYPAYDVNMTYPQMIASIRPGKKFYLSRKADLTLPSKTVTISFEALFETLQLDCVHRFIDLYDSDVNLTTLPFSAQPRIRFGPYFCNAEDSIRFEITTFNHVKKEWVKHRLTKPVFGRLIKNITHIYTLTLSSDKTFTISVDGEPLLKKQSLLDPALFNPPIRPHEFIPDPTDVKPADWVDATTIDDETDEKPADWDEDAPPTIPNPHIPKPAEWDENAPETIIDYTATPPPEWDEKEDGKWIYPTIPNPVCLAPNGGCGLWVQPLMPNPHYKGKYQRRQIHNPLYKGEWSARLIPNPDMYEPEKVGEIEHVTAVGLEGLNGQVRMLVGEVLVVEAEGEGASVSKAEVKEFNKRHSARHSLEKEIQRAMNAVSLERHRKHIQNVLFTKGVKLSVRLSLSWKWLGLLLQQYLFDAFPLPLAIFLIVAFALGFIFTCLGTALFLIHLFDSKQKPSSAPESQPSPNPETSQEAVPSTPAAHTERHSIARENGSADDVRQRPAPQTPARSSPSAPTTETQEQTPQDGTSVTNDKRGKSRRTSTREH